MSGTQPMSVPPVSDRQLLAPNAILVASEALPGVSYRTVRLLGSGGVAAAFLATRRVPEGDGRVVLKITLPSIAFNPAALATLIIQKEALALGRLAARIPASPYVVRLVDAGQGSSGAPNAPALGLPWLAMEYVHGGAEGTTLAERVERCMATTGYAFDPARAAVAMRCAAMGLRAMHEVGVLHRDLTPSNLLCCGFGEQEQFKVSDFGLARSTGMVTTLGDRPYGTAGFAAPEQVFPNDQAVGPHSDVFSLACVLFKLLAGDNYFAAQTHSQAMLMVRDTRRKSLADSAYLAPGLRQNPQACRALDELLRHSTAWDVRERSQTPVAFAQAVLPWLDACGDTATESRRVRAGTLASSAAEQPVTWHWTIQHPPRRDVLLRQAAWDGDGRLLATLETGLAYFDGSRYELLPVADDAHCCHRQAPGVWIVGGRCGWLGLVDERGLHVLQRGSDARIAIVLAGGHTEATLVIVEQGFGMPALLRTRASGQWLPPWPLPDVASVTSLVRLDGWRWLLTGRHRSQGGFAWVYSPLVPSLDAVPTPACRVLSAAAHQPARSEILIAGADGVVVERTARNEIACHEIDARPQLTAAAIDEEGRKWVGGTSRIWTRVGNEPWSCVYRDDTLAAPFIGMYAVSGRLLAVTSDGAVLDGGADAGSPPGSRTVRIAK
jgi:serine/threonine protein kinase